MKRQIWLTREQCDLVTECLQFAREKLNEGTVLSDAHKMAGRYTYRRIAEILPLFAPAQKEEGAAGK